MDTVLIPAADLADTFDNVLDFMKEASDTIDALSRSNTELQLKVAQTDRVVLEKVASAKAVFPESDLETALGRLSDLGIIKEREITKVASTIQKNPTALLTFLIKVAESAATAPHEGGGITSEPTPAEIDPDGWVTPRR